MSYDSRILGAVVLAAMLGAVPAKAEKQGGILKSYSIDSPASMSIHEEATVFAMRPVMGVFNNLVLYDQHVKQNSGSETMSWPTSMSPSRSLRWQK
jgi:peptide/nickel transport system substrate-binding protein